MFLRLLRRILRSKARKPVKQIWKTPAAASIPQCRTKSAVVPQQGTANKTLTGKCFVVDGDTIIISGTRIRIAGIDAPELHHPWGKVSKSAMINLCKGQVITARLQEDASYDRIVAKCFLPDGTDVAAELVKQGLALDWSRFSGGAYRHFEPEGTRKKLWRAAAKQRGKLHPSEF